ncbi:GNAT family N-acetyltransferase [Oceanibaculum indicum]|uniref:N-acetyltransferase GCN5 n=2 Tax=Oceanibaculum indicum TaxID=526216 RepID=K2KF76_9PROT|nr:GNAT family N-acetyltransferase [Oceanibaculum indicum]EKE76025.1 N-acetyltransferase GCN5 [Oceanibaculum indicum P24]RKQ70613.1 acetyltransferase (GNAT) family protein [Oceanibaculum indicum]
MSDSGQQHILSVRVAELDDAFGVARVQLRSLVGKPVPDDAFEDFADVRAAAFWGEVIESTNNMVLVAVLAPPPQPQPQTAPASSEKKPSEKKGKAPKDKPAEETIVGFIAFGPPRSEEDAALDAEIYAIHADPGHRRQGVGRRLLASAFKAMAAVGQLSVRAWAPSDNEPAESFYLRFGAAPGQRAALQIGGVFGEEEVPETAYDWIDVRRVIPRLDNPLDRPHHRSSEEN